MARIFSAGRSTAVFRPHGPVSLVITALIRADLTTGGCRQPLRKAAYKCVGLFYSIHRFVRCHHSAVAFEIQGGETEI